MRTASSRRRNPDGPVPQAARGEETASKMIRYIRNPPGAERKYEDRTRVAGFNAKTMEKMDEAMAIVHGGGGPQDLFRKLGVGENTAHKMFAYITGDAKSREAELGPANDMSPIPIRLDIDAVKVTINGTPFDNISVAAEEWEWDTRELKLAIMEGDTEFDGMAIALQDAELEAVRQRT